MPLLTNEAITWIRRILPHPLPKAVAVAIGILWFGVGALIQIPIQMILGKGMLPFVSFFPMLLFAGLLGGGTGGLTCLFVTVLWTDFVILPPQMNLALANPQDGFKLALFVLSGGLVAYTGALLREVILRLDRAKADIQRWADSRDQTARELEHRIKNLFGLVLGIAHRTARDWPAQDALHIFEQRVLALAAAQSLLAAQRWAEARLSEVVKAALAPFEESCPDQIIFRIGADASIHEQSAVSLALALHELATNAMKYGALSTRSGRVMLSLAQNGSRLELRWTEQDGPPCSTPSQTGFGTELIQLAFAQLPEAEVAMDYAPKGLACVMTYRLEATGAPPSRSPPSQSKAEAPGRAHLQAE